MVSVIISGIISGALYALTGTGLVLVYRSSRVLNFALGGIGSLAAYTMFTLAQHHVPVGAQIVVAVLVGLIVGTAIDVLLIRPLGRAAPSVLAVATLGTLLIFQGAITTSWGSGSKALQPIGGPGTITIAGVRVTWNDIITVAIALGVIGLVLLLIGRTRHGLAMRAASAGPVTATFLGIDVAASRRLSWAIGGGCGALAAVLILPLTYLSPTNFTGFTLVTFAAVVLGGFTSLSGLLIGSFVFSIALNIIELYLTPALTYSFVFVGVTAILLLRPHGLFGLAERNVAEPNLPIGRPSPLRVLTRQLSTLRRMTNIRPRVASGRQQRRHDAVALIAIAVIVMVVAALGGTTIRYETAAALATYIAVVGLRAVMAESGQLSLGQGGFMAVGAYTSAVLATKAGLPLLATLPVAVVGGAVGGVLVGYLAVRLSGLYLALVTLLFAFAVPELIDYFPSATGGTSGLPMLLPASLGGPLGKLWLCAGLALLASAAFWLLDYGHVGATWRAVRDSEPAAAAVGLRNASVRLGAFVFGAALAGLGGAASVLVVGYVGDTTFSVWLSIYVLVALVGGGAGSLAGCALGAAFITAVPFYTSSSVISPDIIYGVLLVGVFLLSPDGLVGVVTRVGQFARMAAPRRWRGVKGLLATEPLVALSAPMAAAPVHTEQVLRRASAPDLGTDPPAAARPQAASAQTSGCLQLTGVSAGYGLGLAVRDITLQARTGECVALIGPNGAGKSTILRTISGATQLAAGTISWDGQDLTAVRPHRLARLGVAHVPEGRGIFPELSVRENLNLGRFAGRPPGSEDAVAAGLDIFPELAPMLRRAAGTLSGGEQQMLAIARALAARPRLLMLDEPTLGLSPLMVQRVIDGITRILAAGVGVLLVEQNLSAALETSDHAYMVGGGRITHSYEQSMFASSRETIMREYLGGVVV